MHNDFTLFFRKVPSGKKVVYYYAYGLDGQRTGPWTTGQISKTAARNYCNTLIRQLKLLPEMKSTPTFGEFAAVFWDWDTSPYLNDRRKRKVLTQAYADKAKKITKNALIPFFGKTRLDAIGSELIDEWLDTMIKAGYKNSTTNGYFKTLQTMIKWAVKKRIIERDPFLGVQKLIDNRKEKELITPLEFKTLFVDDWERSWNGDVLVCTANKLAALSGMRCCEVLGLRGEYVFENHIHVCAQYDEYGYRPTKTKTKHDIPLTSQMIQNLVELKKINGEGFLFSLDGGASPLDRKTLYKGLLKAFVAIGITQEEIKRRGLNFHAWRHFANTELLMGGLSLKKVQAVIGHASEAISDRYTHLNPLEFFEVSRIQEELLRPGNGNACKPKGKESSFRLLKRSGSEITVQTSKVS